MELNKNEIRLLTKGTLKAKVTEFKKNNPHLSGFILSDIAETVWPPEFVPFYKLYGENRKVAAQEMGKLLSVVAKELNLRSHKESRFGRTDSITRYSF